MKNATSPNPLAYQEFEPFCNWIKEDAKLTLVLHLPGFKLEQLHVYVSNCGTLKITGECPVEGGKRSRFQKELKFPKDVNTDEISAKLTGRGHLYVVMPKKQTSVAKRDQPKFKGSQGLGNVEPGVELETGGKRSLHVAAMAAVAATVTVALGAYATYKYKSSKLDTHHSGSSST
ncbi:hypothetical protein NMG60_11008728 [Bertholletia excelsa]